MGNLLLDELDLFLVELNNERVVDQMGSLPQTADGVLEAGFRLDQSITEGHQILEFQKAVRGQAHGFEQTLTVGRCREGR